MTVYADVLFLVNFSMDLLSLYGAGALLKRKKRSLRLVLAALLGGIYGVLDVIFTPPGVWGIILLLTASVIMCLLAYGKAGFFSTYVVFLGAEAFLGGVMSLLYTAASKLLHASQTGASPAEGHLTLRGFLLALAASVLVGLLTERTLNRSVTGTAEVRVTVCGRTFRFSAVCDSGNLLTDPLTDAPVILMGESVPGAAWLSALENPKGYRVIPYESVGGSGLLFAHKPEMLAIECRGRTYHPHALIAVARGTDAFNGNGGCVPASILRG
ncbi:MAG: sigma-E processing peptidase SpoIIGA [Clostridia bacterium]|nr:sigma-E processing peptidase SpoIIGA [Clostridia bacterium]